MSAADEAREHLTAVIWEVLGNYTPAPLVHHADMIHSAAERYGHAIAADTASDMADRILGPVRLKLAADEYSGART